MKKALKRFLRFVFVLVSPFLAAASFALFEATRIANEAEKWQYITFACTLLFGFTFFNFALKKKITLPYRIGWFFTISALLGFGYRVIDIRDEKVSETALLAQSKDHCRAPYLDHVLFPFLSPYSARVAYLDMIASGACRRAKIDRAIETNKPPLCNAETAKSKLSCYSAVLQDVNSKAPFTSIGNAGIIKSAILAIQDEHKNSPIKDPATVLLQISELTLNLIEKADSWGVVPNAFQNAKAKSVYEFETANQRFVLAFALEGADRALKRVETDLEASAEHKEAAAKLRHRIDSTLAAWKIDLATFRTESIALKYQLKISGNFDFLYLMNRSEELLYEAFIKSTNTGSS